MRKSFPLGAGIVALLMPIPKDTKVCADGAAPIASHPQAHPLEQLVKSARNSKRYQDLNESLKRLVLVGRG